MLLKMLFFYVTWFIIVFIMCRVTLTVDKYTYNFAPCDGTLCGFQRNQTKDSAVRTIVIHYYYVSTRMVNTTYPSERVVNTLILKFIKVFCETSNKLMDFYSAAAVLFW